MGGVALCSMTNLYNKTIWVKYDTERKYVTMKGYTIEGQVGVGEFSAGASVAVSKCYDWVKIKAQFTPIPADNFIELAIDCKDKKIMYVTIIGDDEKIICNTLGQIDKNLIVTEDGLLRSANENNVMEVHPKFKKKKFLGTGKTNPPLAKSASRNLSQLSAKKSGSIEIKEKDCDIRGMAVTNNNTILLADYNNGNIKSVSADGRVLSVLSLPSSPRVITVRDTTTAVATANNNKKIFIINIADYNTLSLISQSQLGYTIMAIVTYKGNLAVTCATEPKTTKLITIYGGVVWSVGRDTLGRNLFDSPYGITTMTTNDTTAVVVVTDARKRTLTMLEAETGIFLRSIDVEGKGPWGIVMDNDNNSYVCYKVPKEICVWSDDFQESKILLSGDKLGDFPRFVVYSAADHSLYVSYHQMSDSRNTVDKFRLI